MRSAFRCRRSQSCTFSGLCWRKKRWGQSCAFFGFALAKKVRTDLDADPAPLPVTWPGMIFLRSFFVLSTLVAFFRFPLDCTTAPAAPPPTAVPQVSTNLVKPQPIVPRTNLLSQFQIKRGFRIELVASAPLVCAPAAMAFDESGRLFVAEMRDYPDKRNQTPHAGRVRVLLDTDSDGFYDSSTIYADELPAPSAIICYGGGVFVAAAPEILFFRDLNRSGLADQRRTVISGFGEPGASLEGQNLANSFVWGLDNRIHAASGEFGGKLALAAGGEAVQIGNNGFSFDPVSAAFRLESGAADSGCAFDSRGRQFVCDFAHPLRAVMYQKFSGARNAWFAAPSPVAECASPAAPIFRFAARPVNAAGGVSVASPGLTAIVADFWKQARGCAIYRGNARFTRFRSSMAPMAAFTSPTS